MIQIVIYVLLAIILLGSFSPTFVIFKFERRVRQTKKFDTNEVKHFAVQYILGVLIAGLALSSIFLALDIYNNTFWQYHWIVYFPVCTGSFLVMGLIACFLTLAQLQAKYGQNEKSKN